MKYNSIVQTKIRFDQQIHKIFFLKMILLRSKALYMSCKEGLAILQLS